MVPLTAGDSSEEEQGDGSASTADGNDIWSFEQILDWVRETFDNAFQQSDAAAISRQVWLELAGVQHHFPESEGAREILIQEIDTKLQALGCPSFEEVARRCWERAQLAKDAD